MPPRLLLAPLLALAFAAACAGSDSASGPAAAPIDPAAARAARLATVDSWLYQLQGPVDGDGLLDLVALDAHGAGLLVVDHSRDGGGAGTFSREEVAAAQADGTIVLAYLSIGEAEAGRFYWDDAWVRDGAPTDAAPPWLAGANPDFPDNYLVEFWDPGWQEIILGRDAYLDRILAAGFDGVYLDRVDAWEDWWDFNSGLPPIEAEDMALFVEAIARTAREAFGRPDFLIFVQNAPDILEAVDADSYLAALDGLGVEDTFYFGDADEDNPLDVQERTLEYIGRFREAGKLILAVDYLLDAAKQADFVARARAQGFLPFVAPRALDRVIPQP